MSNQGRQQASVRSVTGTALDYNGDWMALFDLAGIPAGEFDGRFLAWINQKLSSSYGDLSSAMAALAAANGAYNFNSMSTFDASVSSPLAAGAKVAYIGDSILAYNTYSTTATKEFSQQLRGEVTWLNILDQRYRIENWRDTSRVWGPFLGSTGTLGSNPIATTNASATVTITHTSHGMPTGGSYLGGAEYAFTGATAVGGLTISGGYKVITVPTANTFTITASGTANATTSGGGAAVNYIRRSPAAVAQYVGAGANWGVSADHIEGSIDVLQTTNGMPTSGAFLAVDADIIILAVGTNNINSSESAATVQGYLTALVAAALAHPNTPKVILCTIRPRGVPRTYTLGTDPFTTTNLSATVAVSDPGHDYDVGQFVTFTGASAVGGLTLTGPYVILSTGFSSEGYQVTAGGAASSSATGGGTGVTSINSSTNLLYPVDDARWAVIKAVNTWIKAQSWGSRVTVVDFDPVMVDPGVVVTTSTGATGAAKALYLIDGVHSSPLGSFYAARDVLLPALQDLVADGSWYEEDPTVTGNYFRNGPLTGTGGLASTGCTGSMPDQWLVQRTTGSSLTAVAAKSTIVSGIDKSTLTFTSAGTTGVDTMQWRPNATIAYNRVATGTSLTFNTLATGLNPTVRVTHNTLTNGHPIVGSQITFANASGAHNGVTLNGTWTITAVLNSTNSNCQYEFVATGQTASATGSGAITIDTTYSAANLFPQDSWIRFGFYAEAAAWDKWRNIQMLMQTRNGSSAVVSYRAGRTYDSAMRFMPSDAWEGWIVSDPIKLDAEALASVTNFFVTVNVDVENSVSGTTSAALGISRPFFRAISDPTTDWAI